MLLDDSSTEFKEVYVNDVKKEVATGMNKPYYLSAKG